MRTHEQVVADVERRFNELKEEKRLHEEEMAKPQYTKPCKTCLHYTPNGSCKNPLMLPIDGSRRNGWSLYYWPEKLQLCKGPLFKDDPEQALWEPKPPTFFQKFINIFKGE
jgi:hypothetical protein